MAINIPLELDSGPITWVKAEIDSALFRALEGIDRLRRAPSIERRNAVRAELHQVSGAFELVGIEGLALLVQEFERHFGAHVQDVSPEALDRVDRGCRRLLSHLDEMMAGSPPVPLRFISEYLALGKLHEAKYDPADLFFPDLSRRPARLNNGNAPEPSRMPAFLLQQRRDFQHGLLQWLRGGDSGLSQMRRAIAEIESAYPLPAQRAFWWATHALLEAAHGGFVEPSTALKQLMARVDLQVRRFVEGSTRVADRLRREVLYHVAQARSGHVLVDEVKALYELDVLVPKHLSHEFDVIAVQPAIAHLTRVVNRCKDAWASLTAGRSTALLQLRDVAAELPAACDALQMPDFSSLGRGIASAAHSAVEDKNSGEDLSIELATSLILMETAVEHIAALPSSFRTQVERAVLRLSYAASNAPIPPEMRAETEANSLTRLAQEKQTIAHVAREIRANMRLVELALDAVFRDRNALEELKPVPALLGQVSGAMRMLGWNDANELLSKTTDRLIESLRDDAAMSAQEIDALADVLAGLSFYVDVRERRERDAESVLVGLKRRFLGEKNEDAHASDDEGSVETSLAERQRMLSPLAKALNDSPEHIALRDRLRETLQGVRRDAELLSDTALSQASNEALRLLDGANTEHRALTAAVAAVAAVVGAVAELPPTSAATSRLVRSLPEGQDAGLLEIFVEEATEVVEAVRLEHQALSLQHDRRDLVVELRRAFHTLKGSGRMVGQVQLAEVAWRVEQVLNSALESDRNITEHELHLVDAAVGRFGQWVSALAADHFVMIDVTVLDSLIAKCTPLSLPPAVVELSAISDAPATSGSPAAIDALRVGSNNDVSVDSSDLAAAQEIVGSVSALAAAQAPTNPGQDAHLDGFTPTLDAGDGNVSVLGVSVSRTLFSILTDETREHLQTLDYELALMQFDTSLSPSNPMVRASHTLCGIHRTAGFIEIGDFAGILEGALVAVRRSARPPAIISTIASAVRALRTATLRLQAHSPMSSEEQSDLQRSRLLLQAIIAETGDDAVGAVSVEGEMLEQSHAEDRALAGPLRDAAVLVVAPPIAIESAFLSDKAISSRGLDDPLENLRDDIDVQVLPIFLEEAKELFPRASGHVTLWRQDVNNPAHPEALKRTLHTLKGGARMAGAMRLGERVHLLETRLVDATGMPTNALFDSFEDYLDDIAFVLERLTHNEVDSVPPRFALTVAHADQAHASKSGDPFEYGVFGVSPPDAAEASTGDPSIAAATPTRSLAELARSLAVRPRPAFDAAAIADALDATPDATANRAPIASAFLRVRSDAIEQLADESGEIAIHRARIEAQMRGLKGGLLELTASVVRLRGQLREIEIQGESQIQSRLDQETEFDPLEFDRYTRFQELTRGLAESVNDVATVQQSLLKNLADAETALSSQTRLSRSVQLRLQTLRTVPFSSVFDRLYRVLRQTAKALNKRANLDIRGGRIEIDRSVLEHLTPVLEHLVRNALAHGIESGVSRKEQGKPDIGELTLSARQQGNEVVISLADDGAGIPLEQVRLRAIERGMIEPSDDPTDARLLEFIFQPSFSTAEQVTAIAGRGIGMDVVRNEVAALGGRVEVQTARGVGATFTLSVPLTLAVTQVLLVAVGSAVYGVPSSLIEQVRRLPTKDRMAAMQSGQLDHGGRKIAYRRLSDLIRVPHDSGAPHVAPIIILKAGEAIAAIEVDRILGNQEVVAKPYGPQLARVPGMAGLTVLADGRIALLLNPLNLMPAHESGAAERLPPAVSAPSAPVAVTAPVALPAVQAPAPLLIIKKPVVVASPAPAPPTLVPSDMQESAATRYAPTVLVVDDSLTVRKITSRLLEREGYTALTAKDGLDALQILADANPDLILLDIEMPRMDGFEFTKTIKADTRQSHIPIIMITSRTAEKHRKRAMELGVDEYVGKPYQDDTLMALVAKYARKPA